MELYQNITGRKSAVTDAVCQTDRNPLTQLPGRQILAERLKDTLRFGPAQSSVAVLVFNIEGIRSVNEGLGRAIGDELVQLVAARLRQALDAGEVLGHLRMNKFVIIQAGTTQPSHAMRLAEKLLKQLCIPAVVRGRELLTKACIGIALASRQDCEFDVIVNRATLALHCAQTQDHGRARFFEQSMEDQLQADRLLQLELSEAVATMPFEMHYQPQVEIATRRVQRFEALLRWNHPTLGWISPSIFIPLAEQMGVIGRIGEWVINQACGEAVTWPVHIGVAVNVSAHQIKDGSLVGLVSATLARTGLAPSRLELEITETCLVADISSAATTLDALHALGVSIALDDFGVGYSSLGYLLRLRFDRVKLDQCFIRKALEDPVSVAIIRAVTGLCSSMGMACVAEGVEHDEQLSLLEREGCKEAQGYLLGKPSGPKDVARFIESSGRPTPIEAAASTYLEATVRRPDAGKVVWCESAFERIVSVLADSVIVTDTDLDPPGPRIIYVNPAFVQLTGFSKAEVLGQTPRLLQGEATDRDALSRIGAGLRAGREVHERILNFLKNGKACWFDLHVQPVRHTDGSISCFAAIQKDVTLHLRDIWDLSHVGHPDKLSGVANRQWLLQIVEAELQGARANRRTGPCLAFLNVDGYDQLNSRLGDETAGLILFEIADRLVENVRRVDTVGHMGGGEFAVCMPAVRLPEATLIGERLRDAIFGRLFETPTGMVAITVSIKIAESDRENLISPLIDRTGTARNLAKLGSGSGLVTNCVPRLRLR